MLPGAYSLPEFDRNDPLADGASDALAVENEGADALRFAVAEPFAGADGVASPGRLNPELVVDPAIDCVAVPLVVDGLGVNGCDWVGPVAEAPDAAALTVLIIESGNANPPGDVAELDAPAEGKPKPPAPEEGEELAPGLEPPGRV